MRKVKSVVLQLLNRLLLIALLLEPLRKTRRARRGEELLACLARRHAEREGINAADPNAIDEFEVFDNKAA